MTIPPPTPGWLKARHEKNAERQSANDERRNTNGHLLLSGSRDASDDISVKVSGQSGHRPRRIIQRGNLG